MTNRILLLPVLLALTACSGDEGEVSRGDEWTERRQSLVYSYPADQQPSVPVSAPVVLRFSSKVVTSFPQDALTLETVGGSEPDVTLKTVDDGRTLVLTPEQDLAPFTQYRVGVEGLALADGKARNRTLTFTTRGLAEGPRNRVAAGGPFEVERWIPDGERLPLLDFSNLRIQFSRPLQRDSVNYGDTITLTGPGGTLVDAEVLVQGPYLTLDPMNELTPGREYSLELGTGIEGQWGQDFPGLSRTLVPRDSKSRSTMVQQVLDSDNGAVVSELTGEPINQVPLKAVLLGEDNQSQQSADISVDLAHIPSFPDTSPLRIPKGTVLDGTAMNVLIGGAVPAGFDSGEVSIRFVSDAMGFMLDNPYSPLPEAPRRLRLFMDAAIYTGEPRANGAVTQDLMHLELIGTAMVRDGQLVVDAVSVAEPRVLGVESARSLLSFHMRSYQDQQNAPVPEPDESNPELDAWIPADQANVHRSRDPIVLQFSEPLDTTSVRAGDNLVLTDGSGSSVPFDYHRAGAVVVIEPGPPLEFGTDYQVQLGSGITDLAGNPLSNQTLNLSMPEFVPSNIHSPVVLNVYPGFPCIPVEYDLAADDAGRCQGGRDGDPADPAIEEDDHLPLARQPANRALHATFSRALDPATVNDSTFTVNEVDASGTAIAGVAGDIRLDGRKLTFVPDEPWQPGSLYRYTLHSKTSGPTCGTDALCGDQFSLPLQTRLLAQSADNAPGRLQGGPDMTIFFQGAEPADTVYQPLDNLPTADVNANFRADSGEPLPSTDSDAERNSARIVPNPSANPDGDGTAATSGSGTADSAIDDLNVGCGFDGSDNPLDCPDDRFSFINGSLDTEIVGFVPPGDVDQSDPGIPAVVKGQGGVLVYLHPTRVLLSSVMVHPLVSDAAETLGFQAEPSRTGVQMLRMRYNCDAAEGNCTAPDYGRIQGWIVDDGGTPRFVSVLDLYLDAPRLDPIVKNHNFDPPSDVNVDHDLRSYPLTVKLSGDVTFLDDGRLRIDPRNLDPIELTVNLDIADGLLFSDVFLAIPASATRLEFITPPAQP